MDGLDELQRVWLVSTIGASTFVLQVSVLPLPGMYGYRRLSCIPDGTPEERRHKLRKAVRLLDKAAFAERSYSRWMAHIAAPIYAVASTSCVWIRNPHAPTDRLKLALGLQFGSSIGVALLTFWSVPRRARRDRKH